MNGLLKRIYDYYIVRGFGKWSNTYEKEVIPKLTKRGYSYKRLAEIIVEHMGKEGVLLELGTGTGVLGKEVADLVQASIVGVDISSEMLACAAKKNCYELLINSSAESVPIYDGMCDGIYSTFMMHSLHNKLSALKEMKRTLKKEGTIFILDLFPSINKRRWQKVKSFFHSINNEYGAPAMYVSVEEFRTLLNKMSIKIVEEGKLGDSKDYIHYYFVLRY